MVFTKNGTAFTARALSFANAGSGTQTETAACVVSFTEELRFVLNWNVCEPLY
jgi:hypothetical protein